jgi:hypothetical protein
VHMARLRVRTRSSPPEQRESGRLPIPTAARSVAAPPVPGPPPTVDEPASPRSSHHTTGFLDFLLHAIEDWQRTLRLLVLVLAAGGCVAAILFVLQLDPDRWTSVVAVAASVVGVLGFTRRGNRKDPPEDP